MLCYQLWVDKLHLIFVLIATKAGIWENYGVKIIGVDINAIETTEDREKFRLKMLEN
jgi:carbamoylphosphate synthase large subunit